MGFQIINKPIDDLTLKKDLAHSQAGGFVCFEGWVRDHNEGQAVGSLEYEAFEDLCENEAKLIIHEAKEKFGIIDLSCIHRVGHLRIGEMAVWIGVTAAHRGAAFDACQYLIDEIKTRLPIWKKEHYLSGHSEWVNCQECYARSRKHEHKKSCSHSHKSTSVPGLNESSEQEYYSRQVLLKEVGEVGQAQLKAAKVLVVGCGGLGAPVIQSLASAGVGLLGVCDFDRLDISNLHRQSIYQFKDVGEPKSELAKKFASELNPFIKVVSHNLKLTLENISDVAQNYDYIVDGTDNFKAKFLLNDYCYFSEKVLVQGSIYQLEGQVQSFYSKNDFGCMRCLWEHQPDDGCVGSCVEAGVLGAVPALVGQYQALEVVRAILTHNESLTNKTRIYNLESQDQLSLQRKKNRSCSLCSQKKSWDLVLKLNSPKPYNVDIDPEVWEDYCCIDIRENHEYERAPSHYLQSPMSRFDVDSIDQEQETLLICSKGFRSRSMAEKLRQQGFHKVYSLKGGLEGRL